MKLAYVTPGPLDAKAIDGMREFAHTWPGDVVVISTYGDAARSDFEIVNCTDAAAALKKLSPDVITALHRPAYGYLDDLGATVYTSEYDRRMRVEALNASDASRKIQRLRTIAGSFREQRRYHSMATRAAGLQCNGPMAWTAYSQINKCTIEFREHRIRSAVMTAARDRSGWTGERPLRVAFSGRLIPIKGPCTVIEVAQRLPHIKFTIIGDGPLREKLTGSATTNVKFTGFIPFDRWPEYVQENIDIALLPHPQSDPSGTYHEMLACGIPVIGMNNRTWSYLASVDGLGWVGRGINDFVEILSGMTPTELNRIRSHALAVIEPYEVIAAKRVQHLIEVARQH